MSDNRPTPNFTWDEITCRCCSRIRIYPRMWEHMENLQALRDWWGKPLKVSSGYRCPSHNEGVGGVPNSQHTLFATDVHVDKADPRYKEFRRKAFELFDGIGEYPWGLHLDLRGERAHWEHS